jgi:hypothetical protein
VVAFFLPFLSSHAKAYGLEEVGSSPRHIFHDISKAAISPITMVGVTILKSSVGGICFVAEDPKEGEHLRQTLSGASAEAIT